MIWAILALLGVPLWLCAAGILVVVLNNRRLRKRHGDIPVRVKRPGKRRWTRGHALWVSDVFAWRGSPAAWNEDLEQVIDVSLRTPDPEEQKKLHRLGEGFTIAMLATANGDTLAVAASSEQTSALLGLFEALAPGS
jgi:hypothetical protein